MPGTTPLLREVPGQAHLQVTANLEGDQDLPGTGNDHSSSFERTQCVARALSNLEWEFGDNPEGSERNLLDRLRTCLSLSPSIISRSTVIRQTPLATPLATPPTTSSLSSPVSSTRRRRSVLACGYVKGNSPYCSVDTGQQPESDRDQPVPHALHQVSVHGGRNLLYPVENQSKQQLTLPEIAA